MQVGQIFTHTPLMTSPEKGGPAEGDFSQALGDALSRVNRLQLTADQAIESVISGEEPNIHQAIIALEKAQIALEVTIQVRNKVVEAYQEIMRMQV